jgi:hypothetical protein
MGKSATLDFDDVERRETLPRLAWALRMRGKVTTVEAGPGVEISRGAIFEGVWSSDELDLRTFAMPERRAGVHFFGSAAVRLTKSAVLCFPPTQTLDGLYLVIPHEGSRITVTNSLIWAMREAGSSGLTPKGVTSLKEALQTSTAGLLGYNRSLLHTRTACVVRILYTPFVVDDQSGVFAEEPVGLVRDTAPFTFAAYKDGLLAAMRRCLHNGSSESRNIRCDRIINTMSSGYDGTACAALAKELGFTEVLSLDTGRGGKDDSGRIAAAEMGLTVRQFPRPGNGLEYRDEEIRDYFVDVSTLRQATGQSYAEFIAPLSNSGDLVFSAFESVLPGTIMLTGFHADPVWSPRQPQVSRSSQS